MAERRTRKKVAPERLRLAPKNYACTNPACQSEHEAEYVRLDIYDALHANAGKLRAALEISRDLLTDVYNSRASERFSTIGLSRIQSHIQQITKLIS